MKLHWSTETLGTNWYTCNYWGRKTKRAVLAREINHRCHLEITEKAEVEIEVHSSWNDEHVPIETYHYSDTISSTKDKVMEIENRKQQKNMFLHDKERENKYPNL